MRFTLDPVGDLEVATGTRLAEVRGAMAALTGVAALADAPLRVGAHPLPDDAVAGLAPWVDGCRVGVDDGRPPARPASPPHARWWATVVDGPDVGLVAGARRALRVHDSREPDRDGLGLSEPGAGTLVGLLGTWWWRPRGGLPRPVRRVRVGRDVLVPVRRPRAAAADRQQTTGGAWLWLAPALATTVAALVWRSPALAVLALGSLAPVIARLPHRSSLWGPSPAEASVALATGVLPATQWWPQAEGGLALVGPRAEVLATARALVGAALVDPAVGLELAVAGDLVPDWRWCRWLDRLPPGGRRLVVVDRGTAPQAAPGTALLVLARDRSEVPAGCRHVVRLGAVRSGLPRAGERWAEAHARAIAGGLERSLDALPEAVPLAGLPVSGPGRWAVPFGVLAGGAPAWFDLLTDGPHLLVAGTTGSGKSELLQTLVLALARRHPPDRVAFVLVDFKGGAGLAACRALPHVAGTVSDLDPALAARVLAGVRAELRHRERLLAAAGVGDLEELRTRGPAPPRLVVVVDELLALREDLPGVLPALVRLASQGRSLGIHLVLATQRPSGALDAQVRANVTTTICLRVAEPADSIDVLGAPDAATLPAGLPGRCLVQHAHGAPEHVQAAWAALQAPTPVGWAPPWPSPALSPARPAHRSALAAVVLAAAAGHAPAVALWRPALPERVALDELDQHLGAVDRTTRSVPAGSLLLGLVDSPDERRTDPLVWEPSHGPLVVVGPPGTGRTAALRTVAEAATRAGRAVHVLHAGGWTWPPGADPSREGTVVGADDPSRVLRLVELLAARAGDDVLLVDDLGAVLHALARVPRGAADDLLPTVRAARVALAVAGSARDVRPVDTPGVLVELAGAPGPAHTARGAEVVPGRAVVAGTLCQVALPSDRAAEARAPDGRVIRLVPLPTRVSAADLRRRPAPPTRSTPALTIGVGGDDAGPVSVDLSRGLLVVGPAGSGRSAVVSLAVALDGARRLGADGCRSPQPCRVAVLDDADLVLRSRPDLDELLAGWVRAAEEGDTSVPRVVLTGRTDRVATWFRGTIAALRSSAPTLVLDPRAAGSSEAAGADLAGAWHPHRVPGRAVLVDRGRLVPVQVAVPT